MSFYLGARLAMLLDTSTTTAADINTFVSANPGSVKAFFSYAYKTKQLDKLFTRGFAPALFQTASSFQSDLIADLKFLESVLQFGRLSAFTGNDTFMTSFVTSESRMLSLLEYPTQIPFLLENAAARSAIYNSDTFLTLIQNDNTLSDALLTSSRVVELSQAITSTSTSSYVPLSTGGPSVLITQMMNAATPMRWQSGRRSDSTVGTYGGSSVTVGTTPEKNVIPFTGVGVTLVSSSASRTLTTRAFFV